MTGPQQVVRIRIDRVVIDAVISPGRRSRAALMDELQDAVRRYLTAPAADSRPGPRAGPGAGGLDSAGSAVARAVRDALGPGPLGSVPATGGQASL